jgi:hypothetical protein
MTNPEKVSVQKARHRIRSVAFLIKALVDKKLSLISVKGKVEIE